MTTPAEAVLALLAVRRRIAKLEAELELAKAEKKRLEEIELPPLFLQARVNLLQLENGARAQKSQFAYARLAKEGPKRDAMLDWLHAVGESDAIKNTLTSKWGVGHDEVATRYFEEIKRLGNAEVHLGKDVHWRTLERIVYDKVKSGEPVPLTEIGATFGDHVIITKDATDPSLEA